MSILRSTNTGKESVLKWEINKERLLGPVFSYFGFKEISIKDCNYKRKEKLIGTNIYLNKDSKIKGEYFSRKNNALIINISYTYQKSLITILPDRKKDIWLLYKLNAPKNEKFHTNIKDFGELTWWIKMFNELKHE